MRIKRILIIVILLVPFVVHGGELNIINLDGGTGNKCLILESNGKYLLNDNCIINSGYVKSWLLRKNVTSVSLFIHNYASLYYDIVSDFIDDEDIHIDKVFLPDANILRKYLNDDNKNQVYWEILNEHYQVYSYFIEDGKNKNYDVVELKLGSSFKFGDATVDIIAPTKEYTIEEFDGESYYYIYAMSIVAMVSVDNTKYLMTDYLIPKSLVDLLDSDTNLKADILTFYSHEESDCDLADYIRAVKPRFAYSIDPHYGMVPQLNDLASPFSTGCNVKDTITSMANYYNNEMNGTVTFNVKNDVISTLRCDNCFKVMVNYIDKDTKKQLDTYSSYFTSNLPFYLGNINKEFKNYKYVDDDITDGEVIRAEKFFTVNYEAMPVVINHKFDNNSDEAKVVMLVQKYVNENLRSKLYLNNLRDWNALSVEYIGDTPEGKEYYLKTAVDCDGDKTCIEDATDFDSNNNQYLYNAYVIVDGNSNVKLSFEKSSLVEDDEEEIGEGEVENPKTGSYISLLIILPTFVIILLIGFMVRKNKLYKIN